MSQWFAPSLASIGNGSFTIDAVAFSGARLSGNPFAAIESEYGSLRGFLASVNAVGAPSLGELTSAIKVAGQLNSSVKSSVKSSLGLVDEAAGSVSSSPYPGYDKTCSDMKFLDIVKSCAAILDTAVGQMDAEVHTGREISGVSQIATATAGMCLSNLNAFCYAKQVQPYSATGSASAAEPRVYSAASATD